MNGEFLALSGLQHFIYCRRQWALIHIEQQWAENIHTTQGKLMHSCAHDEEKVELRKDILTVRGMRICSNQLGLSGICDVVEFHRSAEGISLQGREGLWSVYPIEYKKGAPKAHQADELQLCAQAMCLEEMLCCPQIAEGSLFYGETRRRSRIALDDSLRKSVEQACQEMHQLYARGYTPRVKHHAGCKACSLAELCLPKMERAGSASAYIKNAIKEMI